MKHVVLVQILHHWVIPMCVEVEDKQAIFDTPEEAKFEVDRLLRRYGSKGLKNIKIGIFEEREHIFTEEK